ncbi:DUF2500 family protein [uncultured Dubosiella sp.]|uniref:DUF2500 family protein n=1 Tax=uncultured Dubosiella sp. TaxID=1937011 RepID=UPI002595445C|nr:DUF2500 family protein [uncultured Dubosiella sp.]
MKRYTTNKHPILTVHAKVAAKSEQPYTPVPGYEPSSPLFEIAFETANGPLAFEVDRYAYPLFEVGMEGELVCQGPEIVSFEPWIHAK